MLLRYPRKGESDPLRTHGGDVRPRPALRAAAGLGGGLGLLWRGGGGDVRRGLHRRLGGRCFGLRRDFRRRGFCLGTRRRLGWHGRRGSLGHDADRARSWRRGHEVDAIHRRRGACRGRPKDEHRGQEQRMQHHRHAEGAGQAARAGRTLQRGHRDTSSGSVTSPTLVTPAPRMIPSTAMTVP